MKHVRDRKFLPVIGTAMLGLLGATVLSSPAHADPGNEWEFEAREFWTQYGVAPEVQDDLVAGIEVGDLPDSLTGGEVIGVEDYRTPTEAVTIQRFEDGSILVSTLSTPVTATSGEVQPFGIELCSPQHYTGVSYYYGCKITGQSGIVGISFYTDYMIQHTSSDHILNSGSAPQCSIFPGSCTQPSMTFYRAIETGQPAVLEYTTTYQIGPGTGTIALRLNISNNSASTHIYT